MQVSFESTVDDDTPVQVQADVVTWRDEGTYQDGPLMASTEGLNAQYMDGSDVPDSIVEANYSRWADRAAEVALGY